MAALTRSRSVPTNVPNDLNIEYYVQRAKGGGGLIVTEGALITQQGTEWQNAPGIWNKEQTAGWKKIVDAVHAEGGHIFAQLWHVGRSAHPDAPEQKASGQPVYAPSAIAVRGDRLIPIPWTPAFVTPTEVSDPNLIISQFRQAAENAKEAGFDGVELHGANGYIVHQFLDCTSNLRTDSWGGSIENRSKFGLEVLKALVDVFGKKRVSIKLSPAGGYNDVGSKLDLAYVVLVRTYRPFIAPSTPLFLNGRLTPPEAATLIAEGKIDAVEFGVLWIGHPDLAKRVEKGKPLDAPLDFLNLYGHGPGVPLEGQRKGYTDYRSIPRLTLNEIEFDS